MAIFNSYLSLPEGRLRSNATCAFWASAYPGISLGFGGLSWVNLCEGLPLNFAPERDDVSEKMACLYKMGPPRYKLVYKPLYLP